jgi:N-acetylglucosamine-6-phosphate deacetylase
VPTVVAAPGVVADGTVHRPGAVVLADGRVAEVRTGPDAAAGADVVLDTGVLAPGLVDAQVNGYAGVDLVEATPDEWVRVSGRLAETGVTAYAPTFITAPLATLEEALVRTADARAAWARGSGATGAEPVGAHLEGPFLSARRRGAHNADHLVDPTPERVRRLLDAAPGALAAVTLAPEREGALAAVRTLAEAGVLVSVGHSDATAAEVEAAADAGARMVTHVFNAQRPLHHREPGVVGRALVDPRLSPGLILDLHHVTPDAVRLVLAAAGDRVVLVTDAVAATGMPPGRYVLGGEPVVVAEGSPPVRDDGVLAGSGLRLDEAVRHAVDLGVPLASAVDAASRRPADLLGRPDLGRLAPGARGDLVWLDDDLRAAATWVAGVRVHEAVPSGAAR